MSATHLLAPSPALAGEGRGEEHIWIPWMTLAFAAAAVIVFAVPESARLLQFDRHAVACGQIWRIVTGHFTHWSFEHLLWDVMVFVALGVACERITRSKFIFTIALSSLAVSCIVAPQLETYRGLSGIDSALFGLLAVKTLRQEPITISLLLVGFALKSCYELATGHAIFVDSSASGFIPVPLAHIVGGICGAIVGLRSFAHFEQPITIART